MDYITIPGRPTAGSRIETDQGFFEYDGKRWNKYPHECKTQECADEPQRPNVHTSTTWIEEFEHKLDVTGECYVPWCGSSTTNALDHRRWGESGEPVPNTDANQDFAEDMADAYSGGPHLHVGLSTGCYKMPDTRAVRYLLEESSLEEWLQHFLSKQADYGDRANDLGLAGQYAELSRKFIKLRRAMWDGIPLTQESLREVLLDLIGHGFLSLMYVDHPGLTAYPKGQSE